VGKRAFATPWANAGKSRSRITVVVASGLLLSALRFGELVREVARLLGAALMLLCLVWLRGFFGPPSLGGGATELLGPQATGVIGIRHPASLH